VQAKIETTKNRDSLVITPFRKFIFNPLPV
jgi:hypothetical protein